MKKSKTCCIAERVFRDFGTFMMEAVVAPVILLTVSLSISSALIGLASIE